MKNSKEVVIIYFCNITNAPHIISEDHATEESEGYTQFLQTYRTQLNNIMNPDDEHSDDSVGQAEEVDKISSRYIPVSTLK